jgi:hypothetical protein
LFFDDLHTEPGDFARVQKAAEQFVQESLQPEDRVAIFKTSERVATLLSRMTSRTSSPRSTPCAPTLRRIFPTCGNALESQITKPI